MIFINLALIFIFHFAGLILHEIGHALAAQLSGFKLLSIRIGKGKELLRLAIRDVCFVVCAIPINGAMFSVLISNTWKRTRLWIRTFGGPATHILCLLVIYLISPSSLEPRVAVPAMFVGVCPLSALAAANLFLLIVAVLPKKAMRSTGPVVTDGYKLLVIPFAKDIELAAIQKAAPRLEAAHLLQYGRTREALHLLEALIEEFPDDDALKHDIAVADLRIGKFDEALTTFTHLLDSPAFQKPELKVLLKNNVASTIATMNRIDLFERAEEYSREALASNPRLVYYTGTRGAVLVRLGRVNEGLNYLRKAYRQHSVGDDRAAEACFIALGESKKGNVDAAQRWLAKARQEGPQNPLIDLIEKELQAKAVL